MLPYHCGVQPVLYDGEHWPVEAWPFDATNAPKTFSGYGTPKPYTCD